MVLEDLEPRYDNWIWMGWRQERLWTLEMDDLYKTNLAAMKKLYKFYFVSKKIKTLYLEDQVCEILSSMPNHEAEWIVWRRLSPSPPTRLDQLFSVDFFSQAGFFSRASRSSPPEPSRPSISPSTFCHFSAESSRCFELDDSKFARVGPTLCHFAKL